MQHMVIFLYVYFYRLLNVKMLLVNILYFIVTFFYFDSCLEFDTVITWQARKSWNVSEKKIRKALQVTIEMHESV